jgi:hypothetical protein
MPNDWMPNLQGTGVLAAVDRVTGVSAKSAWSLRTKKKQSAHAQPKLSALVFALSHSAFLA